MLLPPVTALLPLLPRCYPLLSSVLVCVQNRTVVHSSFHDEVRKMRKMSYYFQIMILSVSLVIGIIIIFLAVPSNHLAVAQQHQTSITQTSTNYTNYKDAAGRFSIDYPSNWQSKPATDLA